MCKANNFIFLFRLQPPEPAVLIADYYYLFSVFFCIIKRKIIHYNYFLLFDIKPPHRDDFNNAIIFSTYMFCEVYISHPDNRRHLVCGFRRLLWLFYSSGSMSVRQPSRPFMVQAGLLGFASLSTSIFMNFSSCLDRS